MKRDHELSEWWLFESPASYCLAVNEWPRAMRRVFITTLPISATLWLISCLAIACIGCILMIAEGIIKLAKLW